MKQQWTLRRRLYNGGMRGLVWLCAGLTCALLIFLIGYIFYRGVPGLSWQLISGQTSYIRNTVGILPNLLNTLYIILVAMAVVLPLGVGAAIYLTEYAASGRLVRIIEFAAETLTGIPSIIFGLVGMMLFVQKLGLQAGILAGGLTLVMMILPTIIRTTQESLKTVPQSYREGALAVEPAVLLMDEPTSALDPISTSRIEELTMELKERYTIVIVTHNMQQAVRISDRTAFFLLGELVECGPTSEIFSTPKDKRTEDYISGRFG